MPPRPAPASQGHYKVRRDSFQAGLENYRYKESLDSGRHACQKKPFAASSLRFSLAQKGCLEPYMQKKNVESKRAKDTFFVHGSGRFQKETAYVEVLTKANHAAPLLRKK
jgi:hypothetical protein